MTISMLMSSHRYFFIFLELKYEHKRVLFFLRRFLTYIDIHVVHKREECTPLRSYICKAVNIVAQLNVYENVR